MPSGDNPRPARATIPHPRALASTPGSDPGGTDDAARASCAEAHQLVAEVRERVLAGRELMAASDRNLARDAGLLAVERGQARDDRAMLARIVARRAGD